MVSPVDHPERREVPFLKIDLVSHRTHIAEVALICDALALGEPLVEPSVLGKGARSERIAVCHAVEVDGGDDLVVAVFVRVQPPFTPEQPHILAGEGDEVDGPVRILVL